MPGGMASGEGRIYIVHGHRVLSFSAKSAMLVASCGGRGRSDAFFNRPSDLETHRGELFVADTHNDRVVVLSSSLTFLRRSRLLFELPYPCAY
jgi:hypothetical protein